MRRVFYDILPKWEDGNCKGKVNWKHSVGMYVDFIYDDIKGKFEIIDYISGEDKILIEYKGVLFKVNTGNFRGCKISNIIGKRTWGFKIEIGTKFKNEKRDFIITDREYRKYKNGSNRKFYKYKCNKCGYDEGWIEEYKLINGQCCSCCLNRVAVLGINTIWDTDKWMIDIIGEEFSKTHVHSCADKIYPKCPFCKNIKNTKMSINTIYSRKEIPCEICGDGFSYSEKFIFSFLKQLGINFETQLSRTTFKWCKNYRYDFYLPDYNCIIEVHGSQHYNNGFDSMGGKCVSETKVNDEEKEKLALSNGINNYIVINAQYSDKDWLKENILDSKLNKTFDLSNINWSTCDLCGIKSIAYDVAMRYKDNNKLTTKDLSKEFDLDPKTILTYLKKFAKNGTIEYDIEKLKRNGTENARMVNMKKVYIYKDEKLVAQFDSLKEMEERSFEFLGVVLKRGFVSSKIWSEKSDRYGKLYKGYKVLNSTI